MNGTPGSNKIASKKTSPKILGDIYDSFNKNLNSIKTETIEVRFSLSNQVYDGRYINNYWLRETSDPITKISWENVALISYKMAKDYDLSNSDIVKLNLNNTSMEIQQILQPLYMQQNELHQKNYVFQKFPAFCLCYKHLFHK